MRDFDSDPLVVKTPLSYEEAKRFQIVHNRTWRWSAIGMLAIGGLMLYFDGFQQNLRSYLLLAAMVVLLLSILNYSGLFYTRRRYQRGRRSKHKSEMTYFYKNHYLVKAGDEEKLEIRYPNIVKVIETGSMFYIYLNSQNATLISKEGFQKGDRPTELRKLLQVSLGDKQYQIRR